MKKLIKQAKIVYPEHPLNGKVMDLLIDDSKLIKIDSNIDAKADEIIDGDGLICMPAMMDMQVSCGEPGEEYKEDFLSLTKAAKHGGFNTVMMLPNTEPAIDNTSQVKNILSAAPNNGVQILPYGALSKGCAGNDLSEMFDMHKTGVSAFTDGKAPTQDVNLLKRALEYVRGFDATIVTYPCDNRINPGGMVNESRSNTALGIKQLPALSEELMLNRDLYLLEYTQSRMHVSTISTQGSIELIAQAKKKGLQVTAGVALANLLYTEDQLSSFDTNFKTQPPLRDEATRLALIDAVKDGVIDVIVTDHQPQNIELKDCEFDFAAYGMTMLETALPLANAKLEALQWESFVNATAIRPRQIMGIELPKLSAGIPFDGIVFSAKVEWNYDSKTCFSKSHNSPEFGKSLKGKVVA